VAEAVQAVIVGTRNALRHLLQHGRRGRGVVLRRQAQGRYPDPGKVRTAFEPGDGCDGAAIRVGRNRGHHVDAGGSSLLGSIRRHHSGHQPGREAAHRQAFVERPGAALDEALLEVTTRVAEGRAGVGQHEARDLEGLRL
jgi:hypothetical protein